MRGEIITRDEMLAIPAYEVSDLTQIPSEPLVSAIVITYNHETFLKQTIQGILDQQCSFPIELIIGEDKSTDHTLEICLDYQEKYPHLIRIVTWHENVGTNANFLRVWGRARGKYVAICEGDDYWIDPAKLAKQVALMEQSPDTMLYGARVRILDSFKAETQGLILGPRLRKENYGLEDVIELPVFHTSTFLFRSDFRMPGCAFSVFCLDSVMMCAAAAQGGLRCLPDIVSVHRFHENGIHSSLNWAEKYEHAIGIYQAALTFVDERYSPAIRNKIATLRLWLCGELVCELASNGGVAQARPHVPKIFWHLARSYPKKAVALILRLFFPATYRLLRGAWIRVKEVIRGLVS